MATLMLILAGTLFMLGLTAMAYRSSLPTRLIPHRFAFAASIIPLFLAGLLFALPEHSEMLRMHKLAMAVAYALTGLFISILVTGSIWGIPGRNWWKNTVMVIDFLSGVFFLYCLVGSILFFGFKID